MIDSEYPGLPEANYKGICLFLDTADTGQWQHWLPTGLFYGLTTNPLLLERDKIACDVLQLKALANQAFALKAKEIQIQTWGATVY
jgi:transaldolase